MASTRVLFLLTILVFISSVAQAQLKVGDGGLIGYHSDFRKRPVYVTGAVGGGYMRSGNVGSQVIGGVSAGLGYAHKIGDPFYLGGELQVSSQGYFRGYANPDSPLEARSAYANLKLASFLTLGKNGRSWLKVSVPIYSSGNLLNWDGGYVNGGFSTASIGWLYLFKRRPDYERPARLGGRSAARGFSLDLRAGSVYLATGLAPRLNYTHGRWELGLGTLFHPGEAGDLSNGLRFGKDYVPLTTSLGYTLRQTEQSRLQLIGEALLPFGRSAADRDRFERTFVSFYGRYEHTLTDKLAVAVELGPNFMRSASGGAVNNTAVLHGTVGVRYQLRK